MRKIKALALLAAWVLGMWLWAPQAGAVEVSLEENKFEKSSTGYVAKLAKSHIAN